MIGSPLFLDLVIKHIIYILGSPCDNKLPPETETNIEAALLVAGVWVHNILLSLPACSIISYIGLAEKL